MSKKYRVGELRPSQILFTYGIGTIADLPNLAVIVMGLEDWERSRTRELTEPRLLSMVQKRLGKQGKQVKELRLPPLPEEATKSPFDEALHIKAAIADSQKLFVTSANLTEYAFTLNMEMGVLIQSDRLAYQVERQIEDLIGQGILALV